MSSLPQIENPHLTRIFDPAEHVVGVRFEKLGRLYHFDYTEYPTITVGESVIVETVRGLTMGEVVGFIEREDHLRDYKPLLRIATPRDLLIRQQWQAKEVEALINCREAAAQHNYLRTVKFVKAEYTFDGATCTIMYSTEDDINMNSFRRSLQENIQGKLEFRQIGPRDVARIMGGQGACGGPRCCSTFLTDFSPISIKMAKAQNIPLNPTEITGMCGRLRCCLLYEYEQYVEARKKLPKRGKTIGTPYGEAKVIDVYPLRDGVAVSVEGKREFVEREEIIPLAEFRALKEKAEAGCTKNESGGCDCGSQRPKSSSADLKAALDMAHSPAPDRTTGHGESTDEQQEDQSKKKKRRRGRRRRGKKDSKKDDSGSPQATESKSGGAKEGDDQPKKRKKRRRRNNRRNNNRNTDSNQKNNKGDDS
jgi:cell fate regulator YaaT (PSP1 superfamily)